MWGLSRHVLDIPARSRRGGSCHRCAPGPSAVLGLQDDDDESELEMRLLVFLRSNIRIDPGLIPPDAENPDSRT